jgi:hypothetical protein
MLFFEPKENSSIAVLLVMEKSKGIKAESGTRKGCVNGSPRMALLGSDFSIYVLSENYVPYFSSPAVKLKRNSKITTKMAVVTLSHQILFY